MSLPTQYNGKNQSPVGALSGTLARLQASRPLRELREIAKGVTKQLPDAVQARTLWIGQPAHRCDVRALPKRQTQASENCGFMQRATAVSLELVSVGGAAYSDIAAGLARACA